MGPNADGVARTILRMNIDEVRSGKTLNESLAFFFSQKDLGPQRLIKLKPLMETINSSIHGSFMKFIKNFQAAAILLPLSLLFSSCEKHFHAEFSSKAPQKNQEIQVQDGAFQLALGSPVKIMPLGDSITWGFEGLDGTVLNSGGYRAPLYTALNRAYPGQIDFVGSVVNDVAPGDPTDIDSNQEGHSGWTSADLSNNIADWLKAANPHYILLMIGSNDLYHCTAWADSEAALNHIVSSASAYPSVKRILVGSVTPLAPDQSGCRNNATIDAFNRHLKEFVQNGIAQGKALNFVDINGLSGLTPDDMSDGLHPNKQGYAKIAEVWNNALVAHLATRPRLEFSEGVTSGQLTSAYDLALKNLFDINMSPFDVTHDATGLIAAPATIISPGEGYRGQVWTRDAAVNSMLAGSLLAPSAARTTLWAACTREGSEGRLIIRQSDTQFWDRVIWINAAWQHYSVTGDRNFLNSAYEAASESLRAAERDHFDREFGLFKGPSHINDGISGFPAAPASVPEGSAASFDNPHVMTIMTLSSNVIHYQAFEDAARMADELGRPASEASAFREKAAALKSTINNRLWMPSEGRYGYFIHGSQPFRGQLDPSQEALGLSLAIASGVASPEQIASIESRISIAPRGITNIYPHFPRYDNAHPGRHNMSVWPYIQGVWASAMATAGHEDRFRGEMERIAYLAVSPSNPADQQFFEIYNFQTGLYDGGWQTGGSWGSAPHQTWSATSFLNGIHSGLFGLRFEGERLRFAPVLPFGWGKAALRGLSYRDMNLDIVLSGAGNRIASFRIDGIPSEDPSLAANLTGRHLIEITMTGSFPNLARNATVSTSQLSPDYPSAQGLNDGKVNGYLDNPHAALGFEGKIPSGLNLGDERASEWVAEHLEEGGSWARLDWAKPTPISKVRLFDRINLNDQVLRGTVELSDGTKFSVGPLPNDGYSPYELSFSPRSVEWIRFTVDETSSSTFETGLAELEAFGELPAQDAPAVP